MTYPAIDTNTATLEEIMENIAARCHEGADFYLGSGDWGRGWCAATCSQEFKAETLREAVVGLYEAMVEQGGC